MKLKYVWEKCLDMFKYDMFHDMIVISYVWLSILYHIELINFIYIYLLYIMYYDSMFDILCILFDIIERTPPYNLYYYLSSNLNVNPLRKGRV